MCGLVPNIHYLMEPGQTGGGGETCMGRRLRGKGAGVDRAEVILRGGKVTQLL